MAIIQVRTDDGIKSVRIAGDTPTPEEEEAIREAFFRGCGSYRRSIGN